MQTLELTGFVRFRRGKIMWLRTNHVSSTWKKGPKYEPLQWIQTSYAEWVIQWTPKWMAEWYTVTWLNKCMTWWRFNTGVGNANKVCTEQCRYMEAGNQKLSRNYIHCWKLNNGTFPKILYRSAYPTNNSRMCLYSIYQYISDCNRILFQVIPP